MARLRELAQPLVRKGGAGWVGQKSGWGFREMGRRQRMGVGNREMGWDRVGGAGQDDQESGWGRWAETVNISVARQLTWGMWPKFPLEVLDSLLSCHCV